MVHDSSILALSDRSPRLWTVCVFIGLLFLAGCQSCSTDEQSPSPPPDAVTTRPAPETSGPHALASRFMHYAYQGAMLRSDHPLNDSLSALLEHPIGGQEVTVIDTFHVQSADEVGDDQYTVQVQVPHAVTIKAVSWDTSSPVENESFELRTSKTKIRKAPHVVGWPAFQRHIRNVAPEDAETILSEVSSKLKKSPS